MLSFLAQEFHDIAPPIDYSLLPWWVIFCATFLGLALIGSIAWWILRRREGRPTPIRSAREQALERLERARAEIERLTPYQFSIRVSDILRRYVTDQYQLPLTRQTSVEFLSALASKPEFSEEDKVLLADFLNRCDLIKFARYEASREDSRLLLEEAFRFVRGGQLALA